MLTIEETESTDIIKITASGKLRSDDYDQIEPKLERLLEDYGPLKFYIILDDFEGWEPAALLRDLKFDVEHGDKIGPCAIVGEAKWQEYGSQLSDLFFRAKIRFFARTEIDEAWEWIQDQPAEAA